MAAPLSVREKIEKAGTLKEEGNALFKEGKWGGSVTKYHQAMLWVKGLDREGQPHAAGGGGEQPTDEEKAAIKQIILSGHLNIAQAQLKLEKWDRVEANCDAVLKLDDRNVKALFRRAKSKIARGNYYSAEADLKSVRELEPGNKDAEKELRALAAPLKELAVKEKQRYAGMFDRKAKGSAAGESADKAAAGGGGAGASNGGGDDGGSGGAQQ